MMQERKSVQPFIVPLSIKFRDADPAGIMFYGNILGLCHDAFEAFLNHIGISWTQWFQPEGWACPIRHVEVDYLSPLLPGKIYAVEVTVIKVGNSSLGMNYRFLQEDRQESSSANAHVKVTHTFVNTEKVKLRSTDSSKPTLKPSPMAIPLEFRNLFEKHLTMEGSPR